MEVRRTAPVKLIVPDERRDDLHESARQFLHCANRAAEFCWDDDSYTNCVTANTTARDALYKELREETDLTANLVQEAIRRAVQATKGCVERWKQGKRVSQPEFTSWSMVYDKRSATFYRDRVSLSTVNGRVECDFELPADSPTPYERYVLSEEYEFRASTLQYDKATDKFYFHITTRKYDSDESEVSADTEHQKQTVLGIDLGVNSLAVASTGTFWQGDEYDHWCREFEKRRGEMQQRGTPAAHTALLRLGKREEAWRTQYIHTVANEIVTEAVENGCDVIAFEDLTDIRERLPQAKWHHIWAFQRLFEYVEYKAPERGVTAKQVAPNHTSQRCSRTDCGFTHESNRDGEHFHCQKCGYEVNADYNAAKNIGLRPEAETQTPLLAHVGGRRRTSRRACEWWDVERQESPANCRRLIAGSPHQSPPLNERTPYGVSEVGEGSLLSDRTSESHFVYVVRSPPSIHSACPKCPTIEIGSTSSMI